MHALINKGGNHTKVYSAVVNFKLLRGSHLCKIMIMDWGHISIKMKMSKNTNYGNINEH